MGLRERERAQTRLPNKGEDRVVKPQARKYENHLALKVKSDH